MAKNDNDKLISMYFSTLAKQSHKKSPRPKEHYIKMNEKRWGKKKEDLSTD